METGSVVQRAKALIPILIPLFVSAFRRADGAGAGNGVPLLPRQRRQDPHEAAGVPEEGLCRSGVHAAVSGCCHCYQRLFPKMF